MKKSYGKHVALRGVELMIPSGSCYGLVGPNGAGKSTLLKILASVIQDYEGKVDLNGKGDFKDIMGYVPQEICLEQTFSAFNNLSFFGRIYGLKGKRLKRRVQEVLEEVGLADRSQDKVKDFSGGMKRRLNIGCALMHRPSLIIMDEPTVGIDPQSRKYIFQMIHRLQEQGCTIIYATHYMEEVEQICDNVAFIDQGKMIEEGAVDDLLQKYAVPSVFVKASKPLPESMGMDTFGEIVDYNGGLLVKTDNPLLVMKSISTFYQSNHTEVERLELVQPKLEDVFFSLTGSTLRDVNPLAKTGYTSKKEVI
ncbi:ABC transporter ATP-binding protein [Virgibacillus sp. MSJ-26]|uniref:ABC transporter ATP-binding protein n=1 Tax=Virgibacillus sp. MSJ-26 TaxID=2841522 RepID=UPI00353051CC